MRRYLITVIIGLVIWATLTHSAFAFTIQLKDGTYLTGEVTAQTDEGFEFKRWDNGGVASLRWEHFTTAEANRIKTLLKIKPATEADKINGSRIYLSNNMVYEGLVVEETEDSLLLKHITGAKRILKKDILKSEPIQIEIQKVYTTEENYAERLAKINQDKAEDHLKLAEYCQDSLKLYDKAKQHYLKAAELNSAYAGRAQKKIAELDALAFQQKVSQIEKLIAKPDPKAIEDASTLLDNLRKEYENTTDDNIRQTIDSLAEKIDESARSTEEKSFREATKKIINQHYSAMKSYLRKVSDGKFSYSDACYYVSSILPNEIIAKLAKDNKMSEDEVAKILEESGQMEGLAQHTVSYGDGSWLMASPPKSPEIGSIDEYTRFQDKMKRLNEAKSRAASNNELISADTWWEKTAPQTREMWLEAFYAERYFTLVEKKEKPCPGCSGEGLQGKNLCKRCWGALVEVTIIYK